MKINIQELDKAELVAALFNNSKPLDLGFFNSKSNELMTKETAQTYLKHSTYFDYLNGRVMKV